MTAQRVPHVTRRDPDHLHEAAQPCVGAGQCLGTIFLGQHDGCDDERTTHLATERVTALVATIADPYAALVAYKSPWKVHDEHEIQGAPL